MRHRIKVALFAAAACAALAGKADAFHLLPLPHPFIGFHPLAGIRGPIGHLGGGPANALYRGVLMPGRDRFAGFPRSAPGYPGARREGYTRGPDRGRRYIRYAPSYGYSGASGSYGYPGAYDGYGYAGASGSDDHAGAECYDAYGRRSRRICD